MTITAGSLRHRVAFERKVITRDPTNGAVIETWALLVDSVPASVNPLSAKEFMSAQSMQSQVVARIVVRHRSDIDASMRIVYRGKIYNIAGLLADKDSGLEYLTIPVTQGVNPG